MAEISIVKCLVIYSCGTAATYILQLGTISDKRTMILYQTYEGVLLQPTRSLDFIQKNALLYT